MLKFFVNKKFTYTVVLTVIKQSELCKLSHVILMQSSFVHMISISENVTVLISCLTTRKKGT